MENNEKEPFIWLNLAILIYKHAKKLRHIQLIEMEILLLE